MFDRGGHQGVEEDSGEIMNRGYEFAHNVFLDSCSLNPGDPLEKNASFQILKWAEEMVIVPVLPHSVVKELDHPNTPRWVKEIATEIKTVSR